MSLQVIVLVPDDTDLSTLPEAFQHFLIEDIGMHLPVTKFMPGTRSFYNKKPVHSIVKVTHDELLAAFDNIDYGWTLIASQSLKDEVDITDENGDVIGRKATVHMPVPHDFYKYLTLPVDVDGNETAVDENNWRMPHAFAGAADWVIAES